MRAILQADARFVLVQTTERGHRSVELARVVDLETLEVGEELPLQSILARVREWEAILADDPMAARAINLVTAEVEP